LNEIGATYTFEEKTVLPHEEIMVKSYFPQHSYLRSEIHITYDGKKELPLSDKTADFSQSLYFNDYNVVYLPDSAIQLFSNEIYIQNKSKTMHGYPTTVPIITHNGEIYITTYALADCMGYNCDDGLHFYKKESK